MNKIYIVEIRDLTNEVRELNAQAVKVNTFEAEVNKRIKFLAENHISAITSYLNHQLNEVMKFTETFYVSLDSSGSKIYVRFLKKKDGIIFILGIQPYYYSQGDEFIIGKDNSLKTEFNQSFSDYSKYVEILIGSWKRLKKALQEAISKKLASVQEENIKKQKTLEQKLSVYENFEL